jgi:hypothetical protein
MPARAYARAENAAEVLRSRMIALLRRPWIRAGLVLLLSAELSFAGNLLYEHRDHLLQGATTVGSLLGVPPAEVCTTPAEDPSNPSRIYR